MAVLFSFAAGLVFGIGLIVAGMADPGKVVGFLDLGGVWDPSLALVMAGAIAVGLGGFALAARRGRSFLGLPMRLPAARGVTPPLVLGSMAFGVGWGLSGICPGPALVLVGAGSMKGLVFAIAMVAGMGLYEFLQPRTK